jgi:dsDNA-specific endonuclease/ATPase MutS2
LLETTAGMSAADIKDYQLKVFRKTMDAHLKEKGRRLVFIHGKGDGVLRQALLQELKRSYKTCTSQDASFQQYGFGATMVIIH